MGDKQFINRDWQNAHKNVNHPDPSAPQDVATKNYVDTVARGLRYKTVRARATANVDISQLNNGDTVDGVTVATDDLVLLDNQTTGAEDGIYAIGATAGTTVRASGPNGLAAGDDARGLAVSVAEGTANGDKTFVQTAEPAIVNTDGLTFGQLGGSGTSYTADGQGIELSGTTFALELDGTTLAKSASGLRIGSGAAGAGLTESTGVLAVGAGTGVSVAADAVGIDTGVTARWFEASGPASAGATITVAHGLAKRPILAQVKLKTASDTKDEDITDGVKVEIDTTNIVVTFGASQADRSLFRVVYVG